jgi:molecular chaperone GrpE
MSHTKSAKDSPAPGAETPEEKQPAVVENVPVSAEQYEALKGQAEKALDHWNNYVRAMADLENYKKRAAREKQDAIRYANEGLLQKLIPVLDNFEMAQTAAQNAPGDAKSVAEGVAMIQSQLKSTLVEAGLEEVEAMGKPFDPNVHEAVSQQESADLPEGQVVQQLRRGYKFRDRLLRPATVIVSKKPAA